METRDASRHGHDGDDRIDGLLDGLLDRALSAGHRSGDRISILDRLALRRTVLLHDLGDQEVGVVHPDAALAGAFASQRYQIVGEIARGGVGLVLKGRDTDLGRDIAVKVLRDEHADSPQMVERFVEEAQIAGQLQHPGVLPVHELGMRADRRPYFTMKLVRGRTLGDELAGIGEPRRDRDRLLEVFLQVCRTLAYAHARGVIHRDLKPSNILLGSFGEVHVTDWGLAKVLGRGAANEHCSGVVDAIATVRSAQPGSASVTGSVMGTPAYMAPEQARGEIEKLDRRSDVFGLGAILCEILTGRPPFTGSTEREIRDCAARAELGPALQRLERAGLEPDLLALARECLDPAPDRRPRDAGEVAQKLERHFATLSTRAQQARIEAAEARVEAAAARRARKLTLGLAVSVAGIALLVVAGSIGWRALQARADAERADRLATLSAALERASLLQAEAAAVDPPATGPWVRAQEVAAQAARLLREDMPVALRTRAAELQSSVDRSLAEARRDVERRAGNAELLAAVEACRFVRTDPADLAAQHATTSSVFAAHGIRVFDEPEDAVLAALRQRGAGVELALGLDAWALLPSRREQRARLWRLGIGLDQDTDRRQVREACIRGDADAIERLVRAPEFLQRPPETVAMVLGCYLYSRPMDTVFESRGSRPVYMQRERADWSLVERVLRQALLQHPGDVLLNWLMAGALGSQPGRETDAVGFGRAVVAARPQAPEAWYQLGQLLLVAGVNDEAVQWFERVIAERSGHSGAWFGKGTALMALGHLEDALDALERCHLLDPKDGFTAVNLAHLRWSAGRHEEALQAYRVAADHGDHPDYRVYLAIRLEELGREDEALRETEAAHAAFQDAPRPCWELARMLNRRGEHARARELAERAVQSAGHLPEPHYYLAQALMGLGLRSEAIESHRRAETVGPDAAGPPLALGQLHLQAGELTAAMAAYRRALATGDLQGRPLDGVALRMAQDAHNGMGCALSWGGRFDEAVAEFELCISLDAERGRSHENLAIVLERRGEFARAVEVLERGVGHAPYLRRFLVRDLLRLGRIEEAREVASRHVEAVATADAFALLAEVLEEAGAFAEAATRHERAVALAADTRERQERAAASDRCRRLLRLSQSLADVVAGTVEPATLDDLEAAAFLCEANGEPVVAARLWQRAIERHPEAAHALEREHVHRAIGAALGAASAGPPDDADRWRALAREWFAAWLARLEGRLRESGEGLFAERVEELLLTARSCRALAPLRGAALGGLPEAERGAWQGLWGRVDAALARIWEVRWRADETRR